MQFILGLCAVEPTDTTHSSGALAGISRRVFMPMFHLELSMARFPKIFKMVRGFLDQAFPDFAES
jgi:hypothetical protein